MITEERFLEIMQDDESSFAVDWKGDNAIQGLQIIAKYMDPSVHTLIEGAGRDVIWSVNVEDLVKADITEEDVIALRKLNWVVDDDTYLACFV
jgi:hypothetical protein